MKFITINKNNFFLNLKKQKRPWQNNYLSMYSTQWDGITTDPDLMMIPVDDHLVHRGDGAFDVMRCVRGSVYQMEEHLKRLECSAKAIFLKFPPVYNHIRDLIKSLILIGGERDCVIRIILSRGPGSFSTNPYDCPSSQLYVNVIRFHSLPQKYYKDGIPVISSSIPIKKSFFANIKSCNYLPNVLMKMEAIRSGHEFSISLDEDGFLAEGSTENIGVLGDDGVLKFPGFERTLSGITVSRVVQLAGELVKEKIIKDVKFTRILPEDAYNAKEMFLTGTSLNILPVITFDGKPIGRSIPGPIYLRLSSLLWEDMTGNSDLLTEVL
ncbi:MAG: aminotransferase class IV [Deltaproteobacteria bacterium]|nr:aminotransferase class IV [Deltaproteobacteria bacterium]